MSKLSRSIHAYFGSSLFWGPLASVGFYALIHNQILTGDFFSRYFTNHWVLYAETILFFTGAAELLLKFFDISEQRGRIARAIWKDPLPETLAASDASALTAHLKSLPTRDQQSYLVRRLRDALEIVVRKDSADDLDDELKYLSESDTARAHGSYALMRILIWAIPILGFLGTVIGITEAIGQLNPQSLERSLDTVTFGLGIAFDTTALALTLSMILMFGQFLTDRLESRLLTDVDQRVADDLSGRFELSGTSRDPQTAAVQRLAEQVMQSTEKLVQRQAEIWQKTMEAAQRRWNDAAERTQDQLESQLVKALGRSIQTHAETLAKSEAEAATRNRRHWGRIAKRLETHTQLLESQHVEIVKQSQILLQVVEATGQVTKLEDALNQNLAALAGAEHFHDTLLNLAAAVNLLSARLGQVTPLGRSIDLHGSSASKAA